MTDPLESLPEALRAPPPRARTSIDSLTRAAATLDRIGLLFFAGLYILIVLVVAFAIGPNLDEQISTTGGMFLCIAPLIVLAWWATESPTRDARALAERGVVEVATVESVAVRFARPDSTQRMFLVLEDGRRIEVKNGALGVPPADGRVAVLVDDTRVGIVLNGSVFPGKLRPRR